MPIQVFQGRVQQRFSTLAAITTTNPVLLEGEVWIEKDETTEGRSTGRRKVGDGVLNADRTLVIGTAFNDLPFEPGTGGGGGAGTDLSWNSGTRLLSSSTGADVTLPVVQSLPSGITGASAVNNLVSMSQAAYDALGTYDPNTAYLTPAASGGGSVTSVGLTAPTGFDVVGSPVNTSGTLGLQFTTGYSLPLVSKQTEWDTAFTERLRWDGGATGLNASTARTSLGLGGLATQSASGSPTAGQAAEWASGGNIAGVDVTGTGNYVKSDGGTLNLPLFSTQATVTAGTNAQGQGALTADINVITTAANNPSGVTLPSATPGRVVTIANAGANNINVYPTSGVAIDARAVNASDLIRVGFTRTYFCVTTGLWRSSAEQTALSTIAGFGTGVAAALAIATGSAGAPVLFNGAGGTPTSLTLTNATGLPPGGLTMATARLLGRSTAGSGVAEEISIGTNLTLSGGVLSAAGGGGATNLSIANRGATTLDVASDTGTDATIPAATTSLTGLLTSADKTKLDGIATGATANATDAALRDRATHTGTQGVATITGLGSLATLSALGNITSAGAIGSTANLPVITTTGGALTTGTFGTTANTFAQGNDSRFHDAVTLGASVSPVFNLTGQALGAVDHGADRLLFWDDSAGTLAPLTLGTNLSITGTTLDATGGGGSLTVQDEGTNLSTSVTTINFTGAGVTATGTSTVTVNVPTGGGGGDALVANPLSQFASTTSAQLAGVISDETGTGALVFGTGPLLDAARTTTSATVTAGTNAQGQAPLTSCFNVITTAAANPSGVTLPAPPASGTRMVGVVNRGANPVNVYPSTGVSINALAANAAISLPVGALMLFFSETSTTWETDTVSLTSGVTGILPTANGGTGNSAGTVGQLTTARTIGGSSFNGTANVTSFPAPGAIGGTTPSTGVFTTLVANAATSLLLGTAGSAVGSVGFRNATSGTITLAPPTGALGTVTLTLPAITDTLVTLTATQTLTNKTLTSPTLTTPALGTPASGVLTSCTGLPISTGVAGLGTGVATALAVATGTAGAPSILIRSGTAAMGTSAIASGASATLVTVSATGVLTTDVIDWGFNGNPNTVTGYSAASTTGCLVITAYPTADNVNFLVSNPTAASITPGALTLNWKVTR